MQRGWIRAAARPGEPLATSFPRHRQGRSGPHVHFEQDEWFHAIKGEFAIEVGGEMFRLHAGDLVFAPRNVPHAWACVGDTGTILIGLQPALTFELFMERLGVLSKPLEGDALTRLFAEHGMKIVGPPLEVRCSSVSLRAAVSHPAASLKNRCLPSTGIRRQAVCPRTRAVLLVDGGN
jgi:hypothetical protein